MARISDARLHIVVAIGLPILGWLFSSCYFDNGSPYTGYPFCLAFDDISAFGLLPFKWIIAASACVILLSIYRIWSEKV